METYLFSYNHDGAEWAFEVQAADEEDARMRVSKMAYATYDGVLIAKIPARAGLLARAAVALRNLFLRDATI